MVNKFKALLKDEKGQGMTEYGLVLGLIAVAVVGALIALRGYIVELFKGVETTVKTGVDGMSPTAS
ncbi:pilin [Cohnella kolymensis]|uniref:Pilin n=1 Tax=Cohnella kolymensis TaxID=1590652 RepID=A0ABR5A989_9BACL|nr:Flp family type IVb pilin [Cohnella kolymensis]KIL37550.1 pilin [Cohnella kolymensis]